MESYVFNIYELACAILRFCDASSSMQLTTTSQWLHDLRNDELLWRDKVQKEFGVVRFKPTAMLFLHQYLSLGNNLTCAEAIRRGRCDQLRILRRKQPLSEFDVVGLAIKYDQSVIFEYFEDIGANNAIISYYRRHTPRIGPNVALYLVRKSFDHDSHEDYCHNEYYRILDHLVRHNLIPGNFENLLNEHDHDDALLWYRDTLRYEKLQRIERRLADYNHTIDCV